MGVLNAYQKVFESGFSLMTLTDFSEISDLDTPILAQNHKSRYSQIWPDDKTSSYTTFLSL